MKIILKKIEIYVKTVKIFLEKIIIITRKLEMKRKEKLLTLRMTKRKENLLTL